LIAKGANIDTVNFKMKGKRSVHEVGMSNNIDAVTTLLRAGADLPSPDGNGRMVFSYITPTIDVNLIQMLSQEDRETVHKTERAPQLIMSSLKAGNPSVLR
jgi:hypothetical protein